MNSDKPAAATSVGMRRRRSETPLAFIAVISFSAASRLKAYSTATSTAMGNVMANVNGTDSPTNSPITLHGNPFPTRLPMFFAI